MAIERFNDEYAFLSNMYPMKGAVKVPDGLVAPTLRDVVMLSVEHPYQASKFEDPIAQAQVLSAVDGYKAKKVADRLVEAESPIREDWADARLDIMRELVARKFAAGTRLAYLLLNTGEEELIEGNTWDDTFWGVCPPGSGNGLNWLGRTLMDTRQALRQGNQRK